MFTVNEDWSDNLCWKSYPKDVSLLFQKRGEEDRSYIYYKNFNLALQQMREKRHLRLMGTLIKENMENQDDGFIERLRSERGQRYIMTSEQFQQWWDPLDADTQTQWLELWNTSIEETLEESRRAIFESFESRRPDTRESDSQEHD